jgi:hypothetical protein
MTARLGVLILLVAGVGIWWALLPPPPRAIAIGGPAPGRGVVHIHTPRSDGTGTVDEGAAAAARAGLQFVILTDHGDAMRDPDRPVYHSGVLCIDAVEISTNGGHLVAIGLPRSPYPLGGEARDVVEDVQRLGGMAIAAHPESMKPDLRWVEWSAPFDGLEWLNSDSEWRDESPRALLAALLAYPARGPAALAELLDRPTSLLRRWDALTKRRQVVALAGADAHARLGLRGSGDTAPGIALPLPGYEAVFRTFSVSLPDVRLSGDAMTDARAIVDQIRQGHVYTSVDALAAPGTMSFTATSGDHTARAGDVLPVGGPVTLHVRTNAPADAELRLLKDGELVTSARTPTLDYSAAADPAVYRVEVTLPRTAGKPPMTWLLSNPIYVRPSGPAPVVPPRAPATETFALYENGEPRGWTIERSNQSKGALDVVPARVGTELLVRYGLGGALDESPYVAAAVPAGPEVASYDRVIFTGRADRPMRVSVELRVRSGTEGERWHRSVYLDQTPRTVTVYFDDMTPRGSTSTRRPVLSSVDSLLFVVDSTNARPGASGQFWLDDVEYGK